tara:strand:+ start:478 stop:1620 length:1143 start_codon:yes stop_codon:yes gene_type:complete
MAITIKINPPSAISISAAPIAGLIGPQGPAGADGSGGGLASLVADTSPQLGGNLDVNGNKIVSTSNGNIDIEPNGTGDVLLGNFKFDADQTVGAGQDNYILTYDNSTGKISLEAAAAGGLSNIVEDVTPQLGGNLDVQANEITTSTSNGNVKLNPNGTGVVEIKGDGTTNGAVGTLQLNCSNNSHGVKIASPPHSAGASYTLTLPNTDGNANQVLTTDGSGNLSFKTLPQSFNLSFETQLTNGNYFYGNRRYGWNYIVWNLNDGNMVVPYYDLVSAMVAINDYTEISVKGIAGSMLTSNSISIEFSLWKGTNAGGTGAFTATQQGSTHTVSYNQSDEMKPLSFSATGLTINEGDYIFLAIKNPSYSVREDIACSIIVTFS